MKASAHLLDAALKVEQMETEHERLLRTEERLPELVRQAYRRGYLAGRAAQRRGAAQVSNPESTARGWIREVCK